MGAASRIPQHKRSSPERVVCSAGFMDPKSLGHKV